MPRIPTDPLKAFVALRNNLEAKRAALLTEIADIEAALGSLRVGTLPTPKAKAVSEPRPRKMVKNEFSLKDAVVQAVSASPLSKEGILAEVKKAGYRFRTKSPINSLNTILYGKKPKFKTTDGKFSLA